MSQKTPKVRSTNWSYLIPQIAIFVLIGFVFQQMSIPRYWLLSLAIYLLLSSYLKVMIPKWHRKGLLYFKKNEFEGAAFAFKKSYEFFSKNVWIDNYRAFTLLSLSRLSYREMALINMAYCYQNLGKKMEAKDIYKRLVQEFPNSSIAAAAASKL